MSDDIKAVTELVQKQGETFDAFKKANDQLLQAKAEGKAVGDLQASIAKIEADFVEQRKAHDELVKKANRPGADTAENQSKSIEDLNIAIKSYGKTGDDSKLIALHQKAMNSGTDPEGGFLVLPYLDTTIERVVGTIGAMARLADKTTIGTQKWVKNVKTAGMAMRWVANGGTGGETTEPTYAEVSIEVFPGEVEPWVHNETLEDARINLAADLADEASIGFAEGVNAAYITGNGVGKPRGILSYDMVANASYAWGKVGYVRSGKSAAFASVAPADRLINLQHSLKAPYRPGAAWLTNDATLGAMRQMKDGSGAYYLWQPDPTGAFGGRFLGSPVEVDDNMPDLGAGSYSLAYGNWARAYQIVNRDGIKLIRDPYTSKGQTKFNFRKRMGGGVKNYEAFKVMSFVTGA